MRSAKHQARNLSYWPPVEFHFLTINPDYEMTLDMAVKLDPKLKKIVEVLKEEFNPSRLFLFGSRAGNNHRKDSDYDFVIVVPGNKRSKLSNMKKARDLLFEKFKISADVFVYSEKEFHEWKDELNSIPETALNTGRELDLG